LENYDNQVKDFAARIKIIKKNDIPK
jgi:hypothetical protein